MAKKFFNVFFVVLFLSSFCFIGCTDLLAPKAQTDINLNIDLSKIIKSPRNEGGSQGASSLGDNPTIKVAIYDAKDYDKATNLTENLTLITQAQASVGGDGIARVKLSDIPVGIDAIVFADLYEKTDSQNGVAEQLIYAGNSSVFVVKENDNKVSLVLKKVAVGIPDEDNTPEISVTVENFNLYSKVDQTENKIENNSDRNATLTNDKEYTKVTVNNAESNNSVWDYFIKPQNNKKFIEEGNYQVSVDLKADKTSVVEVVGARADYFFTINDTWQTYTFETGYIKNPENQQFSIGLGLSSSTYIRNLKVNKINDNTDLPTLSFNITDYAIKNYLNKTNGEDQIIEVNKTEGGKGYSITVNTPMSHSEATTGDPIQDVTLQLRDYTASKGMNFASFNMTSNDETGDSLKTALEGSTKTSSMYSEKWADKEDIATENDADKTQTVFFPSYKEENVLEECFIDGVFSGGIQDSTTVTISDFVLREATGEDITNAGKTYAITVGGVWCKATTLPFSANLTPPVNCQVIFIDYFDSSPNDENWKECIRFLYGEQNNDRSFTVNQGNTITLGIDLKVFVSDEANSWSALQSKITSTTTTEIFITGNLTATEEITISAPVKLIASENVTISRSDSFTGNFFNVSSGGSLEIAGSDNSTITLDGGNTDSNPITVQSPLITVNGKLTLSNCTLQNNTNSASPNAFGGAVYVDGGTLNFSSGTIQNCKAGDAGAVYITNGGSFEMTGGTIQNCEASLSGGGVWMNKGSSFTMSGKSKIEECKANSEGGGVFATDENNPCSFTMNDSATITGCTAKTYGGGGVSYGCGTNDLNIKFTMNGGTISNCSSSDGGGVYLYGCFVMNGGNISGCAATRGAGVYVRNDNNVLSSLSMSGNAIVNNFVYLTSGTFVTVAGNLTGTTPVATITLDGTFTVGTQVLTPGSGVTLKDYVGKFALADTSGEYTIGEDGKIAKVSNVIELTQEVLNSKINTTKSRYDLTAGEYCVTEDIKLSYPLQIDGSNGEVKIYSNENKTITCSSNFYYNQTGSFNAMIALPMSSGSLTLGGGTGNLTIDGSDYQNLSYLVFSSSSLTLENNCTITNGTVSDGAVYIGAGSFTMNGGTITNNNSTKCSGIYTTGNPATPTTIRINNGTISNNFVNSENKGASIYCYNTNATVNLPGNSTVTSTSGMFTQNIINGEIQDVATGGGGNESLIQGAYYVSATGNDDNDGLSSESPFKTLKKAITTANNSESRTVYVIGTLNASSEGFSGDGGNGESNSVFYIQDSNLGTSDAPIQIIGYGDESTLSAEDAASTFSRVFATRNESHIKMQNLKITGGNTKGSGGAIYFWMGSLILENCSIENNSCTQTNSTSGISYDGIYMYGQGNKLNMVNTTCSDGIYLSASTATIGDGCSLGYDQNESPIIHIDNSQLTLSGSVQLNNPIYSDANSPISVGSTLTTHNNDNKITIKLSDYNSSIQILSVKDELSLADEVQKFSLADSAHSITNQGYIE